MDVVQNYASFYFQNAFSWVQDEILDFLLSLNLSERSRWDSNIPENTTMASIVPPETQSLRHCYGSVQ